MKKFFLSQIAILALSLLVISCDSDDNDPIAIGDDDPTPVDTVISGQITEDLTLTSDEIWTLDGRVTVVADVTLTIEPGTIIKALPGQEANASVLIIARGGNIEANGTAADPIIFTSSTDNIELGQIAGTNLTENDRGLWGGLIVLGNARASLSGDAPENQIEGIPASDTNGLYGGTNDADDSGTLNYISIRHGGTLIGEGNEINGLTLGTVGRGTLINHIEVVGNVDDGIEFFGGTVDATNLLVWGQGDDALDIDMAYSGTIDNAVVILNEAADHAFEIDGPEGSITGSFTLQNVTVFGSATGDDGEYADYRSNAMGTTKNIYALGFQDGKDVELDANDVAQNFLDGKLIFEAWEVVGFNNSIFSEKVKKDEAGNDLESTIILAPTFTERAADWTTQVTEGEQTVGADLSVFSWTYASANAGLGF